MVVIVVNAAADIVMAADQIVAFGVLNRWRIVVVHVFHSGEVGGRDLRHVADHVGAVVVGRNAIAVGSVHLHRGLLGVRGLLALATHRSGGRCTA